MTANARRFFAQPANFRADEPSRTVYLSELLKWYGSDFAQSPTELMRVLRPYFPSAESLDWVESPAVKVKYLAYDWSLNDQRPTSR